MSSLSLINKADCAKEQPHRDERMCDAELFRPERACPGSVEDGCVLLHVCAMIR